MYKHITTSSHPNNVAQWFPCDRKWPIDDINVDKKLKVLFMNNCPKTWKYSGKKISCEVIMKFLEVSWKNCFEIANKEERNPHISVKYQGNFLHNLNCNYSFTLVFIQTNLVVTGQQLAVRLSSLIL